MTVIDFKAFIGRLATSSGETILPFFRTSLGIDNKSASDYDPVTEADRGAEAVMRRLIKSSSPSTPLSARNSAMSAKTPNMSGYWIRSTAPNPLSRAFRSGVR